MTVQLAAETRHFTVSAAFGTVTWGERAGAKTRVGGINLADGAGAWAIGLQAWEGTREIPAATTKPWWDASSFGFTGREHDLGSGLVYARARYLSPGAGRWDRPDPLGFADGTNRYVALRDQPTMWSDPYGLFAAKFHNFIAQQSIRPWLPWSDEPAIEAASVEADGMELQGPEFSFRHGMRSRNQFAAVAMHDWVDFIVSRVASAARDYDCDRDGALRDLGFAFHAVTDAEVAVHRFSVWDPLNAFLVAGHVAYEQHQTRDDQDVQSAITVARYLFDAFSAARRTARFDGEGFIRAYYGTELVLHAQEVVSR